MRSQEEYQQDVASCVRDVKELYEEIKSTLSMQLRVRASALVARRESILSEGVTRANTDKGPIVGWEACNLLDTVAREYGLLKAIKQM